MSCKREARSPIEHTGSKAGWLSSMMSVVSVTSDSSEVVAHVVVM